MSTYVHHVPGRLRVRSAAIKRDEVRARAAKRLFAAQPGVTSVDANPLTGSITILYEPETTSQAALMQLLAENGYMTPAAPTLATPDFAGKLVSALAEAAIEKSLFAIVAAVL